MGRTARGSCPTIGNRDIRTVIPSLVRCLLYLARQGEPVLTAGSRARQPMTGVTGAYGCRGAAPRGTGPRPDGGAPPAARRRGGAVRLHGLAGVRRRPYLPGHARRDGARTRLLV